MEASFIMLDLLYVGITILFFVLALGYIAFCGSLRKEKKNEH